jgi:hypothetical protein
VPVLGPLVAEVEAFQVALRRRRAVNVNDQISKQHAVALAHRYFNDARALLIRSVGESDAVLDHDSTWQQLVRLAHGNNSRSSYVRLLSKIRRHLREFSVMAVVARPVAQVEERRESVPTDEEVQILETLDRLVPSAAASYRQGFNDLAGSDRISYRGTAAEFREALRETLDHLAPDDQVMAQVGFKLEADQTKPTMKQKVGFVLKSRGTNKTIRTAAEQSLSLIDELSGQVMRAVYNRASLATHVQQSKTEVRKIKRYVDTVLYDLLEIAK